MKINILIDEIYKLKLEIYKELNKKYPLSKKEHKKWYINFLKKDKNIKKLEYIIYKLKNKNKEDWYNAD